MDITWRNEHCRNTDEEQGRKAEPCGLLKNLYCTYNPWRSARSGQGRGFRGLSGSEKPFVGYE
jgi:hypothetical protein